MPKPASGSKHAVAQVRAPCERTSASAHPRTGPTDTSLSDPGYASSNSNPCWSHVGSRAGARMRGSRRTPRRSSRLHASAGSVTVAMTRMRRSQRGHRSVQLVTRDSTGVIADAPGGAEADHPPAGGAPRDPRAAVDTRPAKVVATTAPTDPPAADAPPPPAAAGAHKPFDRVAAMSALSAAAAKTGGCHKAGDPVGSAKVTVTFAPNGRASQVAVTAPFSGTKSGACISAVFRTATVPPFEGTAVPASKTIPVR